MQVVEFLRNDFVQSINMPMIMMGQLARTQKGDGNLQEAETHQI